MPTIKKQTPFDELILDTAISEDVEADYVREIVRAFFSHARQRLIEGKAFRVPNFGTFAHKYLGARSYTTRIGSTGLLQTRTSKPAVGVRYVASRRMVQRMREEWRAGKWSG